jgi:hypothetical protein
MCVLLSPGCGLSDPAIRFAHCLEEAIKEHPGAAAAHARCDLELPGSYLVVLHPKGTLGDEQLVSAGLPQALLPELRTLRLGVNPAIFVISTGSQVTGMGASRSTRSSRTTYQMNFVEIDRLMVLAKTTQPLGVDIGGTAERRVIEAIH